GNAVKFTKQGTVTFIVEIIGSADAITITDKYQQLPVSKIRFKIEDTGIGMTTEQLKKIFLPFEQVGDNSHKSEGTGLGLAISSQIIELMGSKIQVESNYGQGTKFWFDLNLPIINAIKLPKLSKINKNIIGYKGQLKTILIVDDVWENRSVFANLLTPLGFKLIEASDGHEGLDQAKACQPDLIITDLAMPEIDGFQMTQILRSQAEFQNTVIIASSASVSNFTRQQSQEAGCNDFLAKP
ncbi:ATP-binding protein, partial [Nostoc sp. NIES-2111]